APDFCGASSPLDAVSVCLDSLRARTVARHTHTAVYRGSNPLGRSSGHPHPVLVGQAGAAAERLEALRSSAARTDTAELDVSRDRAAVEMVPPSLPARPVRRL